MIKNRYIKILFKLLIIFSVFECIYLFALPPIVETVLKQDFISRQIENKTNVQIKYTNPKIKTHIKPKLTVKLDNLSIKEKDNTTFFDANEINCQVKIFPFLKKEIDFNQLYANNLELNINKDKDGVFNFQKLFPKKEGKAYTLKTNKNTNITINNYKISSKDEQLKTAFELYGCPFSIRKDKKTNHFSILTKGNLQTEGQKSDFDVDLKLNPNLNLKDFNRDNISGNVHVYNLNLKPLFPIAKEYIDKNISNLDGFIEFIQLSAESLEETNQIILNTRFRDVIFNKTIWKNEIKAKGENKLDANLEFVSNSINIKSFNFKANNVNIKTNGEIKLEEKAELNLDVEIAPSRVENIAPLLPPAIPKQYRTIEKVKSYGVFGDISAKVKVKGKIPQPNITGFVKGRNIHVLDKSIHPLHKGSVDILFDNRILNMDILIDLMNNQKATIKGHTHMYRDGINDVTIKTTDNIDFPLAQKIIIPISKVFNFQLGPIPEMDITSGEGKIDLNIQGSINYINLSGYTDFDKAQLTYNGLYGEILNGKGHLDFKGDTISLKSERAFVKNNPIRVEGKVRINNDLNFNISSNYAEAKEILEIINNSTLLKDVKEGLAIITEANGPTKLFVNLKSKIVPVPYGHPPLPPEEAFENMKVNGSLYMFGNSCKIEGFKTYIENIKGLVDFTEKETNLNNITGISGTSPITISGKIINDMETRIPDVDVTVTSNSVNLRDTIKFLTQSYLYPENYPDLSPLYKIASKHDLYFKYKAKSIDFVTDKAYAVMNFIPDNSDSSLKAKTGKVTMENSTVFVENINADLFDSTLKINGNVQRVDTINPIYNLTINSNKFNLSNLNNIEKINIIPKEVLNILSQFNEYSGFADANIEIKQNLLNGKIKFTQPKFKHIKSNLPFVIENFNILLNKGKIHINDMAAKIADMPFYADVIVSDLNENIKINGYVTSKITDHFIQNYVPKNISDKIRLIGDVNLSANINGTAKQFEISPKLTFFPDADITIDGTSLGEVTDKREFDADISFKENKIKIKKLDYIKYISSQNNKNNPIVFATMNAILNINENKILEPEEINVKTNKNISARILNLLLKTPMLKQGSFNCDLKYTYNKLLKSAKLKGAIDCKNIDIPLFDTVIKNIKLNAEDNNIDISMFGFLNESKIKIESILNNNLYSKPQIHFLKISADQINNDKLLKLLSKARQGMNTNNKIKNIDLAGMHLDNGILDIKKLTIKSLTAENFIGNFSIDKDGIFKANNVNVKVGQGEIQGDLSYDLTSTELKGNFELTNVDSNYVAETLFDGKNQIYGNANGKIMLSTKGAIEKEIIENLEGIVYFDISDGRMPKLGSLEYLLKASNIIKTGITGFTLNNILELLNLVKTGYFSNINGGCIIEKGIAKNIEIFSTGENLSLYIHGSYDISRTHAEMEILGNLSRKISTVFGTFGNTSLNTFFKLIPGVSMLDFSRKDFIENVEKIPPFTNGKYDSRTFQAIIDGNINESGYVQSFKWVK